MKITRQLDPATIQRLVETGEIEIELTAAETREAYLEEQSICRLEDAEAQFKDYFHTDFGAFNDSKAVTRFMQKYGITANDVIDENSGHYLVEAFVHTFERCHDCNNADNDAWRAAIIDTLEEYSSLHEHRCPHCAHALIDSDLPAYDYLCPLCDENFYEFEVVDADTIKGGAVNG